MQISFMKIKISILFFLAVQLLSAQAPQVINYQAIARDAGGNIVTNAIGIKFRILQGSTSGTLMYEETHTSSPSTAGVFNVGIGAGTIVSGSFTGINWQNGPYFLEVNIDPAGGTSYTTVGTTQLLSVPYALYAEKAGNVNINVGNGLSLSSGTLINTAPNQTVSITSGTNITVSGIYPSYTISSTGSASTSVPNTSVTGTGIATVTAAGTNTFNVAVQTPSLVGVGSTTVSGAFPSYTISTPSSGVSAWSILGNSGTVDGVNFLGTTDNKPLNFRVNNLKAGRVDTIGRTHLGYKAGLSNTDLGSTAVGYQTLMANTTGTAGTAYGFNSLRNNTTGMENAAFGYNSSLANTTGNYNSAFGVYALQNNNGNDNTAVGNWTMRNLSAGYANTAVGSLAMMAATTGSYNTAIGYGSLNNNGGGLFQSALGYNALKSNFGGYNIAIGAEVLPSSTSGTANIGIGNGTFSTNISGVNNTGVGHAAGQFANGSGNVFLGYRAGQNETGSNKLIIANSPTTNLIYGDFALERVALGTTAPAYKLHVIESNSVSAVGAINTYSATAIGGLAGLYASANNPSNSSAAVYATHSGGGNGISGISTSTTYTGTAGVYGLTQGTGTTNISVQGDGAFGNSIAVFANSFNAHTGLALLARKDLSAGNGIVARIENQLTGNTADALFSSTNGQGAAVHAASGTLGTSALALWVENGHIKSTGAVPTVFSFSVAGGFTIPSFAPTITGTDVKGTISFSTSVTGFAATNYIDCYVNFNKGYSVPPTVMLTPTSDFKGLYFYLVSVTSTQFVFRLYRPATATFPTTIAGGTYFNFNYFIIE